MTIHYNDTVSVLEFATNIRQTKNDDGSWTIKCRKGLWSVTEPDLVSVSREALHYYRQYRADGEYGDKPSWPEET